VETQKKKDKEERDLLKANIGHLKLKDIDLKIQVSNLQISKEDGEISSLQFDIKDEVNDMEVAKIGWVDIVKCNIIKG
jgi:hypothetical protein